MINILRIILILLIVIFFGITFRYMSKNENTITKELNKEHLNAEEKAKAFKLKKYFFIIFCLIVLEFLLETIK